MANYLRFQQNLMKAAAARDDIFKKRLFQCPWFEYNDRIFACPEGLWMLGVPKSMFYLDMEKIFKDSPEFQSGKQFMSDALNTEPLIDTHIVMTKEVNGKKLKLHEFVLDKPDASKIYVNDDFLKDFDLNISHFTGYNRRSLVYIWENDQIVGGIMPVNTVEGR